MITLTRYQYLIAGLLLAFTSVLSAQDKSYINPSSVDGDGPVFSGAVLVDDTLYLSGMIGLDNKSFF